VPKQAEPTRAPLGGQRPPSPSPPKAPRKPQSRAAAASPPAARRDAPPPLAPGQAVFHSGELRIPSL
jgi:hypothetical protein